MTIRTDRLLRLLKFGSGAAISFVGTLSITYITTEWLNFTEEISFATSLIVMFFVNFLYLRFVVFQTRNTNFLAQMRNFFMASIGFRCGEYLGFLVLLNLFHVNYLLSVAGVLGVSFLLKFYVFDRHVFHTTN